MEDKKANIIAVSIIIVLSIFIVIARVSLKLSKPFFLIAGASSSVILAIFAHLFIRSQYKRRRKLLESQLDSQGRELRIEYSFLRKVAGRRNVCLVQNGNDKSQRKWQYFPKIVNQKMREGKLMEVVDDRLAQSGGVDEKEVRRLVFVALWCIQEKARLRPSMLRVVEMLEGHVPVEEPPDTQMIIVDLLSIDEDLPDGHSMAPIAAIQTEPVDHSLPTTSTYSFDMSVLSAR
ncbi:hypothetical protein SADUNF_Sadunf18G0055700 [Salix dunnii]|uniref:Uncharacterized protein n=1 Tax=Salix dunnii TaxID=1413687 RepID=A0A835J0S0_9ROSI|nr:hypothetical protein SADUNF_Sadunf18G0055700 [Salix dunnii]